jgi:hypothetical protein
MVHGMVDAQTMQSVYNPCLAHRRGMDVCASAIHSCHMVCEGDSSRFIKLSVVMLWYVTHIHQHMTCCYETMQQWFDIALSSCLIQFPFTLSSRISHIM